MRESSESLQHDEAPVATSSQALVAKAPSSDEDSKEAATESPIVVFVSLKIFDLEAINTPEHEFTAEVLFNLKWYHKDVEREYKKYQEEIEKAKTGEWVEKGTVGFTPSWIPRYDIANLREMKREETWFKVVPATKETPWNCIQRIKLRASFGQQYQLHNFPFDTQSIRIFLSTTLDSNKVVYACEQGSNPEESKHSSTFLINNFVHRDAWIPHDQVFFQPFLTDAFFSASNNRYSQLICTLRLKRIPFFYVMNHMVPTFLIVGTPAVTFFLNDLENKMDVTLQMNKMDVTLQMILTMMAFKFSTSDSLPAISYRTWLDAYQWAGLLFLFIIVAQNVFAAEFFGETGEKITSAVVFGAWLIISMFMGAYAVWFKYQNPQKRNDPWEPDKSKSGILDIYYFYFGEAMAQMEKNILANPLIFSQRCRQTIAGNHSTKSAGYLTVRKPSIS
eukprot:g53538.t1